MNRVKEIECRECVCMLYCLYMYIMSRSVVISFTVSFELTGLTPKKY